MWGGPGATSEEQGRQQGLHQDSGQGATSEDQGLAQDWGPHHRSRGNGRNRGPYQRTRGYAGLGATSEDHVLPRTRGPHQRTRGYPGLGGHIRVPEATAGTGEKRDQGPYQDQGPHQDQGQYKSTRGPNHMIKGHIRGTWLH
jgi:hypothetical protein